MQVFQECTNGQSSSKHASKVALKMKTAIIKSEEWMQQYPRQMKRDTNNKFENAIRDEHKTARVIKLHF